MRLHALNVSLLLGLALGSTMGCTPTPAPLEVPARIVEQGLSTPSGAIPIQGLYFGELEIVAYQYRPGASLQTGQHFGSNGTHDWSYWVVLQSGHEPARDNLLTPGQEIDVATLDNGNGNPPEQPYIDQVGVFDMDLFEVNMFRTGVLHDNVYYGMNADLNGLSQHPLHKYPALASVDDHYCMPEFPGQSTNVQDESVIFARPDWFPQPVLVTTRQEAGSLVIANSSIPLTSDQQSLILSLVNNGTQRRFYSSLLFVPFSNPVAVDLDGSGRPGSVPGAQRYVVGDFQITVHFDLSNSLAPATDFGTPRVVYTGDSRNVPFNLSVTFDPL